MTLNEFLEEWDSESSTITVHTSGSTGTPKSMQVEKIRMMNSARKTCDFLGLTRGDTALLCMPLDYIAGKMVVVRSIERGLRLIDVAPCGRPLEKLNEKIDFAAMVPLQIKKSLANDEDREKLKQIKQLIIGGGAIDDDLSEELKDFPNNVWSTYGMTETLSHIAMRKINGKERTEWYTPLKGIEIKLSERHTLAIKAPEICEVEIETNDIAEINDKCQFRILGRTDNTINSGGVKIQIEECERLIRDELNDKELKDKFRISSRRHDLFGEEVVLVVTSDLSESDLEHIREAYTKLPNKYWHPRDYIRLKELPMTGNGKPDRAATKKIISQS